MKTTASRSGSAAVGHFHYRVRALATVEVGINNSSLPLTCSVFFKSFSWQRALNVSSLAELYFSMFLVSTLVLLVDIVHQRWVISDVVVLVVIGPL